MESVETKKKLNQTKLEVQFTQHYKGRPVRKAPYIFLSQ